MKHFLLFYEATADYTTKRAPFRKQHLQHAIAAHQRGDLAHPTADALAAH